MVHYMSKGKLLFCTGEGIGNVVQTIPVVRTLTEVMGYEVDFWHAFGTFPIPKIIPYVNSWFRSGEISHINPRDYIGKVSTKWTETHINLRPISYLKLLNKIVPLSMRRSEVDTYMDIARDLGVEEESILWHGKCNFFKTIEYCDIVIHNGYNMHGKGWEPKSYPYYSEVAEQLISSGFKVCSVGAASEYIKGTYNLTGLDLLTTLGVIKNCKVFLGNDSGIYHCANALQVPNIVIFTYTSTEKNYDARFHKYAKIVGRDDLECRWCQCEPRFKTCEKKECREVDPTIIVEAVRQKFYKY